MNKFKKTVMLIIISAGFIACMIGTVVGISLSIAEKETNVEVNQYTDPSTNKGNIWDHEDVPDETAVAKIDRTIAEINGKELKSMEAYINTSFDRYKNLYIMTLNVSGASGEYVLFNDDERREIKEDLIASCDFTKILFENDGYIDTDVCVALVDSSKQSSTDEGIVCIILNGVVTYDILEDNIPGKLSDI